MAAGQGLGNILKLDKVKWDQNTSTSAPSKATVVAEFPVSAVVDSHPPPSATADCSQASHPPLSGSSVQRTLQQDLHQDEGEQSLSRSQHTCGCHLSLTTAKVKQAGDTINLVPCQASVVGSGACYLGTSTSGTLTTAPLTRSDRRGTLVDNTIRLG